MRPTFFLILCILFSDCKVNHLTGKKTFNAFSNKQLFPMALQQYNSFLKENEPVKGTIEQQQILKIGGDIAEAAQKYFAFKGQPNFLHDYAWEYNLVKKEGPSHSPLFTVSLKVLGLRKIKASGSSIREAEKNAAKTALSLLNDK